MEPTAEKLFDSLEAPDRHPDLIGWRQRDIDRIAAALASEYERGVRACMARFVLPIVSTKSQREYVAAAILSALLSPSVPSFEGSK